MNKNSRTQNTLLNFVANILSQAISILLAFLSRRIFIENLGIEILGINGLFSNILTFLSLAELGIGSAINYSMYREIANKNEERICALTTYYKIIYKRIAYTVLMLGLLLTPFLRFIVKLDNPVEHLEFYYLIGVFNTVASYMFVYKTSVLRADQREYTIKIVSSITSILVTICKIITVIIFKNYMLYILIDLANTIVTNFVVFKVAEKKYPFISKEVELPKKEKTIIWKNIKDMFIYKISLVLLNSTDNILISVLVNTKMVGFYSNYTMITTHISNIINMFFNSVSASIGNYNVNASNKEKYDMFNRLSFFTFWIYSFATIGIFYVSEDFITALSGTREYILGLPILIIVSVNYYIKCLKIVIGLFRETTGLFRFGKYSILISAIVNLVLSVVFGLKFGLFGILLATTFARLLCDGWYEIYILFKKIFERSSKGFFLNQVFYACLTMCIILLLYPIIVTINCENLYLTILAKFVICCIVPNLIYLILFWRTDEFQYFKDKFLFIITKILKPKEKVPLN